ncbi:Aspartyl/glutamyl-tRNA(Asn/Gln) amidotransferase subunit C [compost metagenome]
MITNETVRHVAKLARLELAPDEEARLTQDLGAILGYVEQLAEVDVTGVEPTAQAIPVSNVLREDRLHDSLTREEVLQNAPAPEQGMFRVPRIIGEA